jgi:hypothetical protein
MNPIYLTSSEFLNVHDCFQVIRAENEIFWRIPEEIADIGASMAK